MITQVLVLNGPNLGRLGLREPQIYGTQTYDDLVELCRVTGRKLDLHVDVRQTDSEAELIGWVHEAADGRIPVVLNAGALTHYSLALMDAVKMRTAPLVEVHISNLAARAAAEPFRRESVLTAVADGIIAGFGFASYQLGLQAIAALTAESQATASVEAQAEAQAETQADAQAEAQADAQAEAQAEEPEPERA